MTFSGMCLMKVLMAGEELVFFELRSCHILKNAPSYKSYRLVQESYALLSLMKSSFSFAINFLFPLQFNNQVLHFLELLNQRIQ